MPRNPPLQIVFPSAGVVRRFGLRDSTGGRGPFPAAWAYNVRLEDSLTERLRGGSFTGQSASTTSDSEYLTLVTENGDSIVTENGDTIVLGPRYSVAAGDGRKWATAGDDAPSEGTADCLYRDRLLRVDDTNGNAIQASRVGNHSDWAMSADVSDVLRPALFQFSEAGETGGDVVAMVPHKDAYLLAFTAGETWIQQGDPLTGTRRNVSRDVGVIGARAWCKSHDTVYFLSSQGLYSVGADGSGLTALSEDKVPEDLTGISDSDAVLDYYHPDRGVYIHLTNSPSWFYDTVRDQFWPFDTSETDSHLLLGPFHLGQENSYGRIQNLQGNMAAGSADVTWRVVTGDTAEEAAANGKAAIEAAVAGNSYSSYVATSGTWSAGRSHMAYPRTRALWCCLWLTAASDWAYEAVAMTRGASGKWR